ncbi:1,2-phenylacetyl-CoA epoxidase subunit PaaC [Amycolatopsis albispora]|uniref:Phenylacetate-CoA oxygenase n=1 Tax=Amycolatopsis albispora TaxID=1804986 RepID=A0A344LC09_9PSEU|nr:1,2-phenylacetyl-CoA epoxidase subunit PaaC [Amycolatopsis albispora]AXB45583.1 phenylacetate-CoA oxygenase [Amycolatopsis albispora]
MSFDNAYEALTEGADDSRWAFGTGFDDPLAGIDTTVPSDVDAGELAARCLALGDDALIMSHRLQEWCTNAPELEDEVALANIGLDLLGQARLLLARAGKADGSGRGEDELAFLRDSHEFRNVRLVELANGDFAFSIARLLVFSTWRLALCQRLTSSADQVLAAIAAKAVKELTYHRDYAAQWTVRLGDGTELSHQKMQSGLDAVWPYVAELFAGTDSGLRGEFDDVLAQVLSAATLRLPDSPAAEGGGREGSHTAELESLLAEMQSVARAHPGAKW